MKTFKCYKATYKVNYRAVSAKGTQNRTQKYNCLREARFSHKIFMFLIFLLREKKIFCLRKSNNCLAGTSFSVWQSRSKEACFQSCSCLCLSFLTYLWCGVLPVSEGDINWRICRTFPGKRAGLKTQGLVSLKSSSVPEYSGKFLNSNFVQFCEGHFGCFWRLL